MSDLRSQAVALYKDLQLKICDALEAIDSKARFSQDSWMRPDSKNIGGGGGLTRILREGELFEQAGVNFSEVFGTLPAEMGLKLVKKAEEVAFFASGISLVIHPHSPHIPTVHANFRYLEVEDKKWFGGGADLTPYVLDKKDCTHFHSTLKKACDLTNPSFYPRFKKECDEYFYIKHRKETRGVGGIFFDYLGKEDLENLNTYFHFSRQVSSAFLDSYLPIVESKRNLAFSERQKEFQLFRRGRYVEFNLVYDRGTHFGLHTNGRTESILMSIPPIAKWQYENDLAITQEEKALQDILRQPIDWV